MELASLTPPLPAAPRRTGDLLTVVVEDYFHVSAFGKLIPTRDWYRFERRVDSNTKRALDLLDEFGLRATFFVLGSVANEMPELVAEIAARGHEVGSKGYSHARFDEMTRDEFREGLRRSREAIEAATGTRVWGHRVARGHLGLEHLWALDVLAEEGFAYDSSVYPRLRSLRAEPWRRFPHVHRYGERELWEIPLATWRMGNWLLPVAGGNYLRQTPHALMRRFVGDWHRETEHPFVLYFHVWELDPELPRIALAPAWTRVRQYRNLDRVAARLRHYLSTYRFGSIREHLGLGVETVVRTAPRAKVYELAEIRVASRTPVTVVVPVYNEESVLPYLRNTLDVAMKRLSQRYEMRLLFVDDGSSDATWRILHETFGSLPDVRFVRHEVNRGVAAAILTGIRHAETEVVCSIDCDCTYDPQQLEQLIPALEDDVAVVTASPYHPSGRVLNVPGWRLALSKGLSTLYRRVFRQKLWTYTSCFRVYRRSALADLPLSEHGFLGVAEMLALLDQRGHRIAERPAVLEARMLGRSKMRVLKTIAGHVRLLARLATQRWVRSPETVPHPKESAR